MFKEYRDYIKDNPEGYWFKAKLYGWGWTSAKWQGWLILLAFVVLTVLNGFRLDTGNTSNENILTFIIETFVIALILIFICYKKGEKPRWQWGLPKGNISGLHTEDPKAK